MPGSLLSPPPEDVRRTLGAVLGRSGAEGAIGPAAQRWRPGDIVAAPGGGALVLGVLLDEPEDDSAAAGGRRWRGWLTAAEIDWAGPHDVLLEPGDGPRDRRVGLLQAWNPVRVRETEGAPLFGRIGAARLAAVRAVQDEYSRGDTRSLIAIASRPGNLVLRLADGFQVLTGTPLRPGDPRLAYQELYRDAARRLTAAATMPPAQLPRGSTSDFRSRLRRIGRFAAGVSAPAIVAAAGAMAAVGVIAWLQPAAPAGDADVNEMRLRPSPEPAPLRELGVRWRDGADPIAIAALLRSFGGEIVDSSDAAGRWRLRVPDPAAAQRALLASPLVAEVAGP